MVKRRSMEIFIRRENNNDRYVRKNIWGIMQVEGLRGNRIDTGSGAEAKKIGYEKESITNLDTNLHAPLRKEIITMRVRTADSPCRGCKDRGDGCKKSCKEYRNFLEKYREQFHRDRGR